MTTGTKIRSAFGDLLRRELDERSVSLKGLARQLAGPDATEEQINGKRRLLQKYLSGEVTPGASARVRIAVALGIDLAAFDEDAERAHERQQIADALLPLADVLHRLALAARERANR